MTLESATLSEWLSTFILSLLAAIINAAILHCELSRRRSGEIVFISNWSKLFCIACLVFGVFAPLSAALAVLPISCYVMYKTHQLMLILHDTMMGFYQLDRLYYCFSQNKTNTGTAYPFCLYVVMYTIGIVIAVSPLPLWRFIDAKHGKCGIDSEYRFTDSFNRRPETDQAFAVTGYAYLIWDISTLLLYACKACSLRRYADSEHVQKRIMAILQRILMLTFLYEIAAALWMVTAIIFVVAPFQGGTSIITVNGVLLQLSVSYSMYLMQQHNTDQYRQFLLALERLRLHYLCCFCCLGMIAREIEAHSVLRQVADNIINAEQSAQAADNTIYETRTIASLKVEHSNVVDLSVATRTELECQQRDASKQDSGGTTRDQKT